MIQVNGKLKEKIKFLLEKHPHLRDSDEKLIVNIWFNETPMIATKYEFLQNYANGLITNAESIRRTRARLQEENSELRGKSYEKRHSNQSRIKNELGYEVNN
jgi:hypothetical protein